MHGRSMATVHVFIGHDVNTVQIQQKYSARYWWCKILNAIRLNVLLRPSSMTLLDSCRTCRHWYFDKLQTPPTSTTCPVYSRFSPAL